MVTKWIILINFFFKFNWIFYCKQFTSWNSVTLFLLATTDIDLAWLCHSTYPSVLISTCQMMNWPNKFQIWSSTSTLSLSIGTLQRNEAQLTDKYRIMAVLKVEMDIIISITASPNDTHMMKISIFWGRKVEILIQIIEELNKTRIVHGSHVLSKIKTKWVMLEEDLPNIILAKFASNLRRNFKWDV